MGRVNLEPPFSHSVFPASLTRVRYSLSPAYKAKQHERASAEEGAFNPNRTFSSCLNVWLFLTDFESICCDKSWKD